MKIDQSLIVTGVTNLGRSADDSFWDLTSNGVELAWEEARVDGIKEFAKEHTVDEGDNQVSFGEYDSEEDMLDAACDHVESTMQDWESDGAILVGDWLCVNPDRSPLDVPVYRPDVLSDSKYGFAGIYRREHGNILQVVSSKFVLECHYCSPCYPNQGDLDTNGNANFAYCLPPDYCCEEWLAGRERLIIDITKECAG